MMFCLVPRDLVRILFTIAALNELDVRIGNASLNTKAKKRSILLQAQNGELLYLLKHMAGPATADAVSKIYQNTGDRSMWDPNGYCWTHGFKVKKGHSSKTCKSRGEGHKEDATRSNTMGG